MVGTPGLARPGRITVATTNATAKIPAAHQNAVV